MSSWPLPLLPSSHHRSLHSTERHSSAGPHTNNTNSSTTAAAQHRAVRGSCFGVTRRGRVSRQTGKYCQISGNNQRDGGFLRSFATICTSINVWEVRGGFCDYGERPNTSLWECLILNHLQVGRRCCLQQDLQKHKECAGVVVPIVTSAANRLIGEVVQSRRRPLLGPSPG